MTTRNMHCVEESNAGKVYNRAKVMGLFDDKNKKDDVKSRDNEDVSKRVYVYTKSSKFSNVTTMM